MAVIAIGLLWPPAFRDASDAGPADDPVLFSKEARFITRVSAEGPRFRRARIRLRYNGASHSLRLDHEYGGIEYAGLPVKSVVRY